MASCPGHACFIVRHCAYFLSHLLFVSLHSGCVTMCMFTTPLFLHSSFARILTYLVDAVDFWKICAYLPRSLYSIPLAHILHITISLYPWISAYLHPKITTSIFTAVPIYPHTYIHALRLLHSYIPISLYSYFPIHITPLSLSPHALMYPLITKPLHL